MFRNQVKRARLWVSLGLVLGVLLLPLPATAGGLWERTSDAGIWGEAWAGLLEWLGLKTIETSSSFIDPNGKPPVPPPSPAESSSLIDPDGRPSSSFIDPDGQP
jgi:hypothetical protein